MAGGGGCVREPGSEELEIRIIKNSVPVGKNSGSKRGVCFLVWARGMFEDEAGKKKKMEVSNTSNLPPAHSCYDNRS